MEPQWRRIRFVAVPRSEAKLLITDPSNKVYCSEGHASVGYVPNAHVVIFPSRGLTHALIGTGPQSSPLMSSAMFSASSTRTATAPP
jgi:hypothetical protein